MVSSWMDSGKSWSPLTNVNWWSPFTNVNWWSPFTKVNWWSPFTNVKWWSPFTNVNWWSPFTNVNWWSPFTNVNWWSPFTKVNWWSHSLTWLSISKYLLPTKPQIYTNSHLPDCPPTTQQTYSPVVISLALYQAVISLLAWLTLPQTTDTIRPKSTQQAHRSCLHYTPFPQKLPCRLPSPCSLFSKTTSHVFSAVSKQAYTDHYLIA